MRAFVATWFLILIACQTSAPTGPGEQFWAALRPLCGQAFAGRLTEGTEASDAAIGEQRLVMHVRRCSDTEIRIPFHVGQNRSRTWVITRTATGLRLKHDHRHEDGTPDQITQYGGDAKSEDDDSSLDFFADQVTASLIPAARTNVWTLSVEPGKAFAYALRRTGSGRRFRVEFDLTNPVPEPPAPW